jgi:hypothetical protein
MRLWQAFFLMMFIPSYLPAAERYAAMFADDSRAEEAEVREWNEPTTQPKIGGRLLFDPTVPVRWIMDRQQMSPVNPGMYVEFEGGDRLAGEVLSYRDGRENPYESQPPHLVVRPLAEVQPPDVTRPAELRVTLEWVRRIVWEPVSTAEYRPGTAWLRTGTSMSFRSFRWSSQGIALLTAEGLKEVAWSDLGEIHFPKLNPWNAYYEQLATLSPQLKSRLIQLTGTDGSRWTTSVERFQARHLGDRNRPEQWYQLIQPAWSLDSIWLRYRTIRRWGFFAPHEFPLSNLVPAQATHQALFGKFADYQRDQNIQNGTLQSSDYEFGWGFGVQGSSELVLEYPEGARSLRTRFGLDRIAETGGCVDVEVLVGNSQSVLKQANLIGSKLVGDINWQPLPAGPPEHRRITLRTGMAHQGRPAGADPFDVRDIFNWYEPELRFDPAALEAEVAQRRPSRLPGLIGWTLSADESRALQVTNVVDLVDARDPQFRLVARTTDPVSLFSRNVKVGPRDRWLGVVASRFAENTSPTSLQIRVDGRVLGEFDVPIRQTTTDPEPMLIPVANFQGKSIAVEVIAYPKDDKSWIDWRGIYLGHDRPGLLTIYEDDERMAEVLNPGNGQLAQDPEKPYSGTHSLKISSSSANNPRIRGLDTWICEQPQLGQYRYVLFAWKKPTGSRIQLQFANRGQFSDGGLAFGRDTQTVLANHQFRRTQGIDERGQKFGYCYEQGVVTAQAPFPLWLSGDLPKEWKVIQRDLFADFGLFNITGLSLNSIEGDPAWLDHFYLARTSVDLEYASRLLVNPQPVPPQPDGNGMLTIARREDYPVEFSRIAPFFSSIDLAHGLARQLEHRGQTDLLRTHANAADKPTIFHAAVVLPKDRPMMLDLHVTHQPLCDWQLVVRANGQVLYDQLIDEKLTTPQRGWATIQVDLAKFAGQKVLLEVLNQSNNWQNETSFWKRLELVDQ